MNASLHWSFDYTRFNGQGFEAELTAALQSAYAAGRPAGPTSHYTVLPNFWGGYNWDAQDTDPLAFGSATIDRTSHDAGVGYHVDFYHEASGERLVLDFQSEASPLRPLTGDWRIHTTNDAPDEYNGFDAAGTLTDSGTIRVATRDIPFVEEQVPKGCPLICNWTLFDIIPALAKRPPNARFALLEDLEKLKPHCRIAPQDTCHLDLDGLGLELRGYVIFGVAQVPLWFWLDPHDTVAIATNIFHTFVLSSGGPTR